MLTEAAKAQLHEVGTVGAERVADVFVFDFPSDTQREVHASQTVAQPRDSEKQRTMLLTSGYADYTPDGLVETRQSSEYQLRIANCQTAALARGPFLNGLETHGVTEDRARDVLQSDEAETGENVIETEFTARALRERRQQLVTFLETRHSDDTAIRRYLEDGSFRQTRTGTDDATVTRLAKRVSEAADDTAYVCYQGAMTGLSDWRDDDRFRYAEGLVTPFYGGVPQKHAWVEISGTVVDPTWPWHSPVPPQMAVYYGITFAPDEAFSQMRDRGRYCRITMPDEQYEQLRETR